MCRRWEDVTSRRIYFLITLWGINIRKLFSAQNKRRSVIEELNLICKWVTHSCTWQCKFCYYQVHLGGRLMNLYWSSWCPGSGLSFQLELDIYFLMIAWAPGHHESRLKCQVDFCAFVGLGHDPNSSEQHLRTLSHNSLDQRPKPQTENFRCIWIQVSQPALCHECW